VSADRGVGLFFHRHDDSTGKVGCHYRRIYSLARWDPHDLLGLQSLTGKMTHRTAAFTTLGHVGCNDTPLLLPQ
jgi:hypothetical protein